ncbi:hypothetical protein F4861DRAFT_436654 [Xylaria intraflava]|nr:hypothetical protein F4861DRAFT_436654 [Xylaria intraflava]
MHQADCNRLLVSHSQYPAVPEPGDDCTTQSGIPLFEHTVDELPYTSSPASQGTETPEPVLTPTSDQPPCPPSADIASYYPQLQSQVSYSSTSSLKGTYFASSASEKSTGPLEVVGDISHLDSPIIPTQGFSPSIHYPADSATGSPMNWPASDVFHPQFTWDRTDSHQNHHVGTFAPTFDDQFSRQIASTVYGDLTNLQLNQSMESGFPEHRSEAAIAPDLITQSPEPPVQEASPQLKEEMEDAFQPCGGENLQNLIAAPPEPSEADEGTNTGEPYAKLIFKAFMSRDSHAMTLQEIYQWFRENTDKAKSESKGWQNSIRHNLSMNAAFVKRDRNSSSGEGDSQETKKSTEWVLQDWAIRDGVQSTTRYRRGNPNRRGGSASHHRSQGSSNTARASSGRRGGISSSKNKSVGARRSTLNRTAAQASFHGHSSHGGNVGHGSHSGHQEHRGYQDHGGNNGHNANFTPYHQAPYHRELEYHYSPTALNSRTTAMDMNPTTWAVRTASHTTAHGGMGGIMYSASPSQGIADIQQAQHAQYTLGNMDAGYPVPQHINPHTRVTGGMMPMPSYGNFFSSADGMDGRGLVWDTTASGEREFQ